MRHRASRKFWQFYRQLPEAIRHVADENYVVLKQDPKHPSLRFKKAGRFWFGQCVSGVTTEPSPWRMGLISCGCGSGTTASTSDC